MTRNLTFLAEKREHVLEQIAAIEHRQLTLPVNGVGFAGTVEWQRERLVFIDWLPAAGEDELIRMMRKLERKAAPARALLAARQPLSVLPDDVVKAQAFHELALEATAELVRG